MADLKTYAALAFETTLDGTLAAGATTVDVQSTGGSPPLPFYLVIDPGSDDKREVVLVDGSKTATSFTLSGMSSRGQDGTDDVEHGSGAVCAVVPVSAHINDLHDRVDAARAYTDTTVDNATSSKTARAYMAAATQSIASSTVTVVALDTESFDTDAMWDAAVPTRLTVQRAGYFLVTAGIFWATTSTAGQRIPRFLKNGSLGGMAVIQVPGDNPRQQLVMVVNAAVGDYFELAVFQDSGGALDVRGGNSYDSWISVTYLGA